MKFRGEFHQALFAKEIEKRNNPSAMMISMLYLLTADNRLWSRVKHHVSHDKVDFEKIKLGDVSTIAYILYMTAKDLCIGTKHITVSDLADKDVVPQKLFGILCEAMTLRRYGVAVLNAAKNEEVCK